MKQQHGERAQVWDESTLFFYWSFGLFTFTWVHHRGFWQFCIVWWKEWQLIGMKVCARPSLGPHGWPFLKGKLGFLNTLVTSDLMVSRSLLSLGSQLQAVMSQLWDLGHVTPFLLLSFSHLQEDRVGQDALGVLPFLASLSKMKRSHYSGKKEKG